MRHLTQNEIVLLKEATANLIKDETKEPYLNAMAEGLPEAMRLASATNPPGVSSEDEARKIIVLSHGQTGWFLTTNKDLSILIDIDRFPLK